jgi:hypothetical protein
LIGRIQANHIHAAFWGACPAASAGIAPKLVGLNGHGILFAGLSFRLLLRLSTLA